MGPDADVEPDIAQPQPAKAYDHNQAEAGKEKTIKRRNLERAEKLGIPYPGM